MGLSSSWWGRCGRILPCWSHMLHRASSSLVPGSSKRTSPAARGAVRVLAAPVRPPRSSRMARTAAASSGLRASASTSIQGSAVRSISARACSRSSTCRLAERAAGAAPARCGTRLPARTGTSLGAAVRFGGRRRTVGLRDTGRRQGPRTYVRTGGHLRRERASPGEGASAA